jgi:hypothetical protein
MNPEDVEAVLVCAARMTDVMSRVPVNLDQVLRRDNEAAVIAAARECVRCAWADACDEWIAAHDEGGGHTVPAFCPNAELMKSFRPRNG